MNNYRSKFSINSLMGLFLLMLVNGSVQADYEVFSQGAYIKVNAADAGNEFGRSVAASGNTMVVGTPSEYQNRGAIYIFTTTDDGVTWTQRAHFTGNAAIGDQFGMSVAISEDESTVIAGAPGHNGEKGAVYTYELNGGTWNNAVLSHTFNGVGAGDRFGWSVGLSDDAAIIGAPSVNASAGAAYAFIQNANNVWSTGSVLKTGATGDNLGSSVAILNGVVAVGAYGANSEAGAVYIFTQDVNAFFPDTSFPAPSIAAGDWFGASVAVSSGSVVVGAPRTSGKQGAAYVFTNATGGGWTQENLIASATMANDFFGTSVALNGSVIVVGSPGSNRHAGAAYVFKNAGNGWQAKIARASSRDSYDFFGHTVAVTIDESILVGAYGEASSGVPTDDSKNHAGAVYTFQSEFVPEIPGDENADGGVTISDVIAIINLVLSGSAPVNGSDCSLDDTMTIDDVVCAISAVLQ